jgi:hypothetical protein
MGKPGLAGTPAAVTRSRLAVRTLGVLALALAIAVVPLDVLSRQGSPAEPLVAAASFTAVGLVVARRRPRNPMGWLLAAIGILILLTVAGGYYAVLVYRLRYRLPLGPLALVLDVFWEPALLLLPLVILLFPDGRLPSRRWQWTLEAYLVLAAGYMTALIWAAVQSVGTAEPVDASGAVNAVDHPPGWLAGIQAIVILLYVPFWLSFVARQVQSWRHADGERRQQLKWLVSGAVVCMIAVSLAPAGSAIDPDAPQAVVAVGQVLFGLLVALPVCIGVGILKYRLYEIDRIISRTLAYAIVTGLLIGVYTGLVLLATHVLSFASPEAVAASTLAAAALFNPLRRRVQRIVDRRFNRAHYDAEKTIAGFAAQLKDAMDPDAVGTDLLDVVHRALEPTHASVWASQHEPQKKGG